MKAVHTSNSFGLIQRGGAVFGCRGGYINFLVVLNIGIVCIALLFYQFRAALQSQDVQREIMVRVDNDQREEAILRALLSIVPNKAMETMYSGSVNNANSLTWETIFLEAMEKGNAFEADADDIISLLPHDGLLQSNPSDVGTLDVGEIVRAIAGESGIVSGGVNRSLGQSYPPYLQWSGSESSSDALYPVITFEKKYGVNAMPDAQLSHELYPLYNRINYPNIRFGYAEPGEPFIAKRNWWAFEITYGAVMSEMTGIAPVTKRYVLSIYEVPSQLPISANAMANLGMHADADQSAWDASRITIEGGVFGSRLRTEGNVILDRLATRSGLDIQGETTIGGEAVVTGFDSGDFIQQFEAASAIADANFFPVSVAGSGRVVFVPLNVGMDFYRFVGSPEDENHLSPTGWREYSRGAFQCAMRLIVTETLSEDDQAPVEVSFSYLGEGGQRQADIVYRIDDGTWTSALPFQPDSTATGRSGIGIDMNRMVNFLQNELGVDLEVNNSLLINPDPAHMTVREVSHPSDPRDMVVIVRECEDFTAFSRGFSFVTNCRFYYANDFNIEASIAPEGSGLEGSGDVYYPPVSVFAPEQRYGISGDTRNIVFSGSVASLDDGSGTAANPLDFVSGSETVEPERIRASLKSMSSPAELPPIHLMNWLLTIEEVR